MTVSLLSASGDAGGVIGALFAVLVFWCLLGGLVGWLIGRGKGRGTAGFWFGFWLGWIGWIIVALLQSTAPAEAARQQEIQRLMGGQQPAAGPAPRTPAPRSLRTVTWPSLAAAAAGNQVWLDAVRTAERCVRAGAPEPRRYFFASAGDGTLVVVVDGLGSYVSGGALHSLPGTHSRPLVVVHTLGDGTVHQVDIGPAVFLWPHSGGHVREFVSLFQDRAEVVDEPRTAPPAWLRPAVVPGASLTGTSDVAGSVAESLRQLEQLRAGGLLSDGEYEAKRAVILDRL